jgi:hypothetical protein
MVHLPQRSRIVPPSAIFVPRKKLRGFEVGLEIRVQVQGVEMIDDELDMVMAQPFVDIGGVFSASRVQCGAPAAPAVA